MNGDNLENLKVALVHDFLNQYGGAERVLAVIRELFPRAPIYTLIHDPKKLRGKFKGADIRPSFLQKLPEFLRKRQKYLLPLMPTAPETFNLRDFDLVISSSSAFAKGVIVKPKTVHISYCHSPMRYAWDWNEQYLSEQGMGGKRRILARLLLNYVRMWDKVAADRVDYFIANSKTTQSRIKKYYGRKSFLVYPPVDNEKALGSEGSNPKKDYFLIVSRLSPYKKIEVAIETFNKLNLSLVVIGEGSPKYMNYLKSIAGPKVKLLGWQTDEKTKEYFSECRAFLFPGEDDFGIAPVEAMAHGKPVIALRKGGATETVIEGVTGEFFEEPILEALADAIRRFIEKEGSYEPSEIEEQAGKFSKQVFKEEFLNTVRAILKENREKGQFYIL